MSKEKECKCCKRIWYEDMLDKKLELCPNCYEYCKPLIDGLKIEYKRIADVQHRLDVAENALELCERHHIGFENPTIKEQVEWRETRIKENTNHFKEQAEKKIKGEKL